LVDLQTISIVVAAASVVLYIVNCSYPAEAAGETLINEEAYSPGSRRIWERTLRDFESRPEPEGQEDAEQLQGGDLK